MFSKGENLVIQFLELINRKIVLNKKLKSKARAFQLSKIFVGEVEGVGGLSFKSFDFLLCLFFGFSEEFGEFGEFSNFKGVLFGLKFSFC